MAKLKKDKNADEARLVNAQELVIEGLAKALRRELRLNNEVQVTPFTNHKYLRGLRSRERDKLTYPFVAMSVSTVDRDEAIGERKETLNPMYGKLDDSASFFRKLAVVRAVFSLEVVYITDDWKDALDYVGRWNFARSGAGARLAFGLDYYGVRLKIRAFPSTSITMPTDMDYDENTPVEYELRASIECHGYLTNVGDTRDFGTTPAVRLQDVPRPTAVFVNPDGTETTETLSVQPIKIRTHSGA
jgi:hypothetical protein